MSKARRGERGKRREEMRDVTAPLQALLEDGSARCKSHLRHQYEQSFRSIQSLLNVRLALT